MVNKLKSKLSTKTTRLSAEKKSLRTCKNGHKFYKSSDCPVCPVCESNSKPAAGFLSLLSAPARRALENKGIKTIKQLSSYGEPEILKLHGMGKGSLPVLRSELKKAGSGFKKKVLVSEPQDPKDIKLVNEHIKKLEPGLGKTVELIRKTILTADKNVGERIKWNNPSCYYTGEMKPFNPKEYKRDIVVFNLHKGRIMLVFPSGAKVNDESGLLEGNYTDGRRLVIFKDMDDVKTKAKVLQQVIKKWIKLIDR